MHWSFTTYTLIPGNNHNFRKKQHSSETSKKEQITRFRWIDTSLQMLWDFLKEKGNVGGDLETNSPLQRD